MISVPLPQFAGGSFNNALAPKVGHNKEEARDRLEGGAAADVLVIDE